MHKLRPRRLGALTLAALAAVLFSCSGGAPRSDPGVRTSRARILPTNAAAVDLVFDLVGPERIVALPSTASEFANVPLDPSAFGPERRFSHFSAEQLLAFTPDLAVVSPWQGQDTIERMREAGIEVIELQPVETLDDIRAQLTSLGAALGAKARAAELLVDFDRRVEALANASAGRAGQTAISYTNYGSGGWVAGSGSTADMVMSLAGLENRAAADGRVGHDTADIETILTWDPDWIVVSKPSTTYGVTRAYLEGEAKLADLRAIRSGHIVEVPAALFSTTSHYLVGAAEALVRELDRVDPAEE